MSDSDPTARRRLRPIRSLDTRDDESIEAAKHKSEEQVTAGDVSVDSLESAVHSLEERLSGNDGIDGLATWLREVEQTVRALDQSDLEHTRSDIRDVIDRLLGINAEVQNVVRLKKLLS